MEEIWKNIIWYEWHYQVSNLWRVKSIWRFRKNWKNWYFTKDKILIPRDLDWYKRVDILHKNYLVHRLVYLTFNSLCLDFKWQKTNTLVLHKNDIKDDNRLDNLFLWTQKDNVLDMISKWRMRHQKAKKIKIWFEDIPNIKILYKEWKTMSNIWNIYWVSCATISRAINWKIWE